MRIVERSNLRDLLAEQDLARTDLMEEGALERLAARLRNADLLLFVSTTSRSSDAQEVERWDSITRVAGTKGGATWDPLTIYTEQNGVPVDITPQAKEVNPFFAEVAHFVDCCTKRTPCKSGAEHGVHLQQMLDGIYKSAETGKEVRVR